VLLAFLALIGAGIGYIAYEAGNRSIELREDVRGTADQAVEELRGLVNDNRR